MRAMEVRVEDGEVGDAGKQAQRLAHDVDGDGRVQRRQSLVAFDFVDELGRDELVLADGRSAAHRAMTDGSRDWELAGVQRIGHELECHRSAGHGRRLIHQLLVGSVLDPELAEVGADAVDCPLKESCPLAVAGFVNGKLDGRRTAVQD
jgi:hypothetical protein